MQLFGLVLAALTLVTPSIASPTPLKREVEKYAGETTGKYIVKLKDDTLLADVLSGITGSHQVTDQWSLINGFAGYLDNQAIDGLHALDSVEYIAEDGIMHATVTQTGAPWGLQRISQRQKLSNQDPNTLNFTYKYDRPAGEGVDVYVIDTGVFIQHADFGGRARWGATFGGYDDADGNGHGTHVAGTIAGQTYGVAKGASIIAVKVLSDQGKGSVANIISALDWVKSSARQSGRPSVASMSLGGDGSRPLDAAATSLVNAGVHVVVAAGNSNKDASNVSPARAPGVLTVGASTIDDARAPFSNYGAPVKIFAPGLHIISTWIGSSTATKNISGTSMATPHVSGIVAYLLGQKFYFPPPVMIKFIQGIAVRNALTDIPADTVNLLAQKSVFSI